MEFLPSSEHLCYVRCSYCNIVLAVGIPSKRASETVTVKCGHCHNISFFTTCRPPVHTQPQEFQMSYQGFCPDLNMNQPFTKESSSTSNQQMQPKVPFVVKPPERKHRLPSAYNRFMKEEIQRIKSAKPEIRHREAFSMAAKNWARFDPNASSSGINSVRNMNQQARTVENEGRTTNGGGVKIADVVNFSI